MEQPQGEAAKAAEKRVKKLQDKQAAKVRSSKAWPRPQSRVVPCVLWRCKQIRSTCGGDRVEEVSPEAHGYLSLRRGDRLPWLGGPVPGHGRSRFAQCFYRRAKGKKGRTSREVNGGDVGCRAGGVRGSR